MNTPFDWFEELRLAVPGLTLRCDVAYSELTLLGVGSSLPLLAEPADEEQLAALLKFSSLRKIRWAVIGGGTNLVGMDAPCPLPGLRLAKSGFARLEFDGSQAKVGAFLRLPELATRAAHQGLSGLAKLAGIPGTVGGAIRMNAGAGGVSIGDLIAEVYGYRLDGSAWSAAGSELTWSYRQSSVPDDVIITGASFKLTATTPEAEGQALRAELQERRRREPAGRSAGCTFRNVSEFEPAGRLIDECGLKNFRIGSLVVSEEHANYIVNTANAASEADYLELLSEVRRAVAERHGFYLRPEVRFLNPDALTKLSGDLPAPAVNLLLGGVSSEREVSIRSGNAVAAALTNAGFQVEITDLQACEVTPAMRRSDVVYPVLHGGFGEDGELQAKLEAANLKFVGSGSVSCKLVMDKILTKKLLDRYGIPTARWGIITPAQRQLPEGLNYPVILKVPNEGSTVGIIKVDDASGYEAALDKELAMASEILVEEFIRGVEITVPIVNGKVLPAIEIRSPQGFYDWDAKYVYKNGHTQYFCPVESLPSEQLAAAARYAEQFYLAARCRDILRVDFIVGTDGVPYMLEGNALPGCTATSLVPKAARVAGISFERMTSTLVYAALKRPGTGVAPTAPATAAIAPVPDPRPEPAAAVKSYGANRFLVKLCRWCFRITLLLCALPLLLSGLSLYSQGESGFYLIVVGLFIVSSEAVFHWLRKMEESK